VLKAPEARFMIHAGDLVNRAHRNAEWGEWARTGGFFMAMVPSIPTPGNHEYGRLGVVNEEGVDPRRLSVFWQPQFTLPTHGPEGVDAETSYYIDFQGVRIIALNSARDQERQTEWLDAVLASNDLRWTIVTHHHPIFSSAGSRDNRELREAWKPIYDRHGVDLVLQGHDHTYGRGRSPALAENLPSGHNLRDDETGTVYVVSVGGRKQYEMKEGFWDGYGAEMDRHAENTQLFQVIRIDGDRLTFEAYTATGELYDTFELVKQEGRPNRFIEGAGDLKTYRFKGTDKYVW
jgi:3',5'-cyclic AMP phosphodiesterase CpdA